MQSENKGSYERGGLMRGVFPKSLRGRRKQQQRRKEEREFKGKGSCRQNRRRGEEGRDMKTRLRERQLS